MNKVELSKQISSKMSIKQVEALRFIHTHWKKFLKKRF